MGLGARGGFFELGVNASRSLSHSSTDDLVGAQLVRQDKIYYHYCSVKASWSWKTAHRGGTVYGGGQCSAFPNSVSRAGRLSAVF